MSSACEKVYGYTVEDFKQNANLWFDLILEEDRHVIAENQVLLDQGKSIVNVYRIRHSNGDIRWMESKLTPTMNADGQIIRLDGFTSDITQRKEAEDALKNSEHKFRSLIENAVDAILVLDEKLQINYASNSVYRITGYTANEIMSRGAFSRLYEEDKLQAREVLQKVLHAPGKTIEHSYRQVRKDGTVIWCEGAAINLLHDEAVNGIVVNFRDVTLRKEYEDALQQSNEELKKSNNELDRFVYSVSHDLRAPLSSIIGMVELIEADASDEMLIGDLKLIKDSINKLDGFILDILDYSRNSRMELKQQEIHFPELINDIVSGLKYMAPENRQIDISVNIEALAPFYSDEGRISIIINNLVSNAIRYSDYSKPDPSIQISVVADAEKAILIVKDNGIGISKEKHDKIFEIFYRVSKVSKGSGLGLYILKETVEKLRGTIQLHSELNKGSEFIIELPNLHKTIS
ncbi:MAG: PAS domain-containing sensor histidine kinase, partial [Bacteroidetes bacterium]|nr:PAS domain-containing sensor histidine kinase [Bacteroidota bacterium]